jgi:high-affinity iron transporter
MLRRRVAGSPIVVAAVLGITLTPLRLSAAAPSPAPIAEGIRASLVEAQLTLAGDPPAAHTALAAAQTAYEGEFAATLRAASADADARIANGFALGGQALQTGNAPAFAAARAQVWTALLAGSYAVVQQAVLRGDTRTAQAWLPVREFRIATRFSRPNADATLALQALAVGRLEPEVALLSVRADLLDTYQARLNKALADLTSAQTNGYTMRRAEHAALAEGYFLILAPAYAEQRGPDALASAKNAWGELHAAALDTSSQVDLASVESALKGFRAAPLTPAEQTRRANQLLRYLSLVPIEYRRGVANGQVTRDFEIQEALTFRDGAAAAFADLQALLEARDPQRTAQAAQQLAGLESVLLAAMSRTQVTGPDEVQARADELSTTLKAVMPAEWQKASVEGDFDVIASMLDQMEKAARAGEYDLAESARLEGYALLEVGLEAKLMVFAPQLKLRIESLFWNGQDEAKGLAYLIRQRAPYGAIKASRAALDAALNEAQTTLGANSAPTVVATNAAVIVFREGLEAVVILASLMSSLKREAERRYRRPLWLGALGALLATALTWLAAQGLLLAFARYGERLEAVVSLIAIAVLLLITNWFFHKMYWTDWITNFHVKKKRLISGEAGLWLGLMALGFTSVYREGFETVLFLQALVLEGGTAVVLTGVVAALAAVLLIGVVTFRLQSNLPYKKMLIATGVLIGVVLLMMVGNTVHVWQVVGGLPIHLIAGLDLPFWLGTWFGVFATWEGIGAQAAAAAFVVGSYYLAEYTQKRLVRGGRVAARPAGVG